MPVSISTIKKIIGAMPEEFDSHDVIKQIMHRHQRAYADALVEKTGRNLFHKLHTELGKQITEICNDLGYARKESRSLDVFGQSSRCIRWHKSPVAER